MRDEDERARVLGEEALEPLHGVDVEVVGGLVEQKEVGVGEQRSRQRHARELAARQRQEAALEHVVGQAEALDDAGQPAPVPVAAGGLEAALQLLVGPHRVAQLGAVLGEAAQALLGGAQRRLELHGLAERLQEVVADRAVALQFGRLFVEPDPAPAGAGDGAGVGVFGARDEPQQRGLAGAVAADEHGVVVTVDGERHRGEQALSTE